MIAEIIDTKSTPARKRARGGTLSGSDASPPNDIVSSPHGANQGHDAKRVKLPVAVRWESGLTRYADDEEFVPADNDDEDAAETPSRGSGASAGKKVRLCCQVKSCLMKYLKLTGSSDNRHATTQIGRRVLKSRQIPLGQTRRKSFLSPLFIPLYPTSHPFPNTFQTLGSSPN